ncbi:MAG: deoxyribodipyrimidine photo-lyase [Lewinellaceae bacterium]|nr:deoxyribodipyrimidine photo-lyase [Lewinellaceae bacterium]
MQKVVVFWFRRDLRLEDNTALFHALSAGYPVLPLFIFDRNILDELEDRSDLRVNFIHQTILSLAATLHEHGGQLLVKYGKPQEVWQELLREYPIAAVYTNRDYEPYARQRDAAVAALLAESGITLHTFKDHVIFEEQEILSKSGTPYTVFTPYSRTWKAALFPGQTTPGSGKDSPHLQAFPSEKLLTGNLFAAISTPIPSLAAMNFEPAEMSFPPTTVSQELIRHYDETRNFPAQRGTSRLGIHFRFGTISIREKARKALALNETYLNELIWRDFYAQILANFPHVATQSFRPEYDRIAWRNDEAEFQRWCAGTTGYPIVDAGMRELNTTGFMHNRVRMITASFLTKHLLIDWRWGEAYFAKKLLDFDLASNNGGWQWAAGCGTDAAPYFRVFNPTAQQEKFDPELKYVRRWVPEYGTTRYPRPMVDHKTARERCLAVYQKGIKGDEG